jgi:peptide/nickel transport system permease protein
MLTFILRRIVMIIPVTLGVVLLVFIMSKVTPGDPAVLLAGDQAGAEDIERLREQLGLNDPVIVQFGHFVWNLLHGDLGRSYRGQTPVLREILDRFPRTVELALAGFIVANALGIPFGLIAAQHFNRLQDRIVMFIAMLGLSIPNFWLAISLIILFGVKLKWVSVTGDESLKNLILPAFCLGLHPAAIIARLTRSSVLEVQKEDYVRTARGKGLREKTIMLRHILRNAAIPIVTYQGMLIAGLLGGTFFLEAVFARPGIGRLAIGSIGMRDYPIIQGLVLFTAVILVVVNLFIDLIYGLINPRIRYE